MNSARPESGPEFFGVGQSTRHKSISPWSPDRYVVADLECHLTAQDVDYFVAVVMEMIRVTVPGGVISSNTAALPPVSPLSI